MKINIEHARLLGINISLSKDKFELEISPSNTGAIHSLEGLNRELINDFGLEEKESIKLCEDFSKLIRETLIWSKLKKIAN